MASASRFITVLAISHVTLDCTAMIAPAPAGEQTGTESRRNESLRRTPNTI